MVADSRRALNASTRGSCAPEGRPALVWAVSTFDGQRQLSNPTSVSAGIGAGGMLFGLPFLGVGLLVLAVAVGTLPTRTSGQQPPTFVLLAFGSVFAVVGAFVMIAGLRGWLRQRRRDALFATHPDEPWRGDYPWDPRHSYDRASNPIPAFGLALFMTLFLSMFNYFAFFTDEVPLPIKAFIGLFDLVLALVWLHAFYVLGRRLKYGATRVRFDTFPFLVGHPLRVTLELPRALRSFPELRATLRLAEQKWETHYNGNKRNQRLVTYERWAEEQVIPRDRIDGAVTLEFMIPAGAPTNDLASPTARYWELQLDAETPGIDYHGLFLLPVY